MRSVMMLFGFMGSVATAGEFNSVLSIGDAAPAWKELEGVDGKKHALADLEKKNVIVVVFTCNSCPIAAAYEDRLIAFAEKHCGKNAAVALVAINVNTIKDDLLPKMKERAEKKKFNFPYLYDPSQEIAKSYGAKWTPEFFVLTKDRKIAYMGAMDDKTKSEDVKENYLLAAVDAVAAGKAPTRAETPGRGCKIRFVPKQK